LLDLHLTSITHLSFIWMFGVAVSGDLVVRHYDADPM
jgi:hypothetical protein